MGDKKYYCLETQNRGISAPVKNRVIPFPNPCAKRLLMRWAVLGVSPEDAEAVPANGIICAHASKYSVFYQFCGR